MQNSRWHDPLGSSASGCNSEPDVEMQYGGVFSDCDENDEEAFISFTTTESKCEQLFEQGLELKLRGEFDQAIQCFSECMKRMQECQYFAKLPQTLHQLAELYNRLECYDKAVEFAQAEKLFYEAVIVNTGKETRQQQRPRVKRKPFSKKSGHALTNTRGSNPAEYGDLLIKKAEEFDKLCRICAQEKKFDLALDYCGKAAKIRQSIFGEDHPTTVSTLEYFTVLYAEVGRAEYVNAFNSLRGDEDRDSGIKGDLSHAKVPTATNGTQRHTHVTIHDTNEKVQLNCESKHCAETSGSNDLSMEPHSPTRELNLSMNGPHPKHILKHSFNSDPVNSVEETGPLHTSGENSKQETVSCTELNTDSYVQTNALNAFDGHSGENAAQCNLLQPTPQNSSGNNIQSTNNDIQNKHMISNPLKSLHSIHRELNAIKEIQGCGVGWQTTGNRGIEQARCLPVWVLLLGAFIEMALLAYFLCFQ